MSHQIACLLLIAVVGCRSDADQSIDSLVADGINVTRDSAGEVFWVDASQSNLNEQFWDSLSNFERMQQLTLTGCTVSDADLSRLTSQKALRSLDVSYTGITSSGLQVLSRVENLQNLALNGVRLDHSAVEPLCRLTRLQSLSLMDTGLAPEDISAIQQSLPGCLVIP